MTKNSLVSPATRIKVHSNKLTFREADSIQPGSWTMNVRKEEIDHALRRNDTIAAPDIFRRCAVLEMR